MAWDRSYLNDVTRDALRRVEIKYFVTAVYLKNLGKTFIQNCVTSDMKDRYVKQRMTKFTIRIKCSGLSVESGKTRCLL